MIKTIAAVVLLPILLISVSMGFITFYFINSMENAAARDSLILYEGPEDIKEFLSRSGYFNFLDAGESQANDLAQTADIGLTIEGQNAYVSFVSGRISSATALGRLHDSLMRYSEAAAPGDTVTLRTDAGGLDFTKLNGKHLFLSHILRLYLGTALAFLAFMLMVSGKVSSTDNSLGFARGNGVDAEDFLESALRSAGKAIIISFAVILTFWLLIPYLLPGNLRDFALAGSTGAYFALFFAILMTGIAANFLKISIIASVGRNTNKHWDAASISLILIFSAMLASTYFFHEKSPQWLYFIPIIGLHAFCKDAIIYGFESARFFYAAGVNIAFCLVCFTAGMTKAGRA